MYTSFFSLCFFFLFIEFTFVLSGGVLVLLVFRDQIVHVALGFSEFHFVHTFTSVPVQESLSSEHSGELFADSLEELLDGGGVTNEGGAHLESSWWDVANSGFHVVRDPFNEVAGVLVLGVEHLFVDFLHGHSSSEHSGDGQVSTVSWIASSHHVLGIEHLLGKLWDGQSSVLLATSGGQWSETWHEEVEPWEWNHVDSQFSEIGVQLTWESEAGGDAGHGGGDEVVQVTVGWGGEFQGSETDIVEGFVINAVGLVGVFDQLMDGEGGVVWFDDGVRDLWRWDDGEGVHDSVWVFFSDFGDEQSSHTGSGTTTQRVSELKTLKAIARLGLLSHNIQNTVDELGSLGVVTFGPVVTGTGLTEDEVIWSEDLTEWTGSNGVHGTWLEIDEDSSWNVFTAGGFVVVDVDSFELKVGVAMVGSGWVDSVFVGDDLPEFGTDLVTALAGLKVDDFSHFCVL